MDWVRRFLYWWRTVPCPFLCGGRLPKGGNGDGKFIVTGTNTAASDCCPTCGRKVAWWFHSFTGYGWVRGETLKPPPRSTQ